jgi:hypothetical protein
MEGCAGKGDETGFYEGIFQYATIGLAAAKNHILTRLIQDWMPNIRRLQCISIKMKTNDLKRNIEYFKIVIDAIKSGNVIQGENAIKGYVDAEKEFVLSAIKSSKFAHYIAMNAQAQTG